jgi:P-type Ca2+ transporter type 2C
VRGLENLKKAVRFYLACKLMLVLLFVFAVLGFSVLPLLPLHVIILEAFMDLGVSSTWTIEGGEEDLMKRKPDEWGRGRLMKGATFWPVIVGGGSVMWMGVGGVFWWEWRGLGEAGRAGDGLRVVQTSVLLCWLVSHVLLAHAMRTFHRSIVLDSIFDRAESRRAICVDGRRRKRKG